MTEGQMNEGSNLEQKLLAEAPVGKGKNLKMFLLGMAGLVAVAIVLALGIGIYRVYAKGATDPYSLTVARILRLPAMKVNGAVIQYTDFADDFKAIHVMRDYDKKTQGPNANLAENDLSDQVLWRLLNNMLLEDAAKTYNITVADSDLKDLKSQIMAKFKDEAAINNEVQQRYGWDFATYQRKVMRPYILQSKLDSAVSGDQELKKKQLDLANQVLQEIKQGADFAEMAKKYGTDGTAAAGGDLGWFGKGEMVPEFETAAFALKKGEVSANLVQTQYGYHIIKLIDRKTVTKKDAKGKTTSEEQIRASHILFRNPDAGQYLDNLAKTANIHLYLNLHNPFDVLKK